MTTKDIARKMVEESIVLLKNQGGLLPLSPGKKLALFGRAQIETILSGSGSGAARTENPSSIVEECENAGLKAVPALVDFYRRQIEEYAKAHPREFDFSQLEHAVNSGLMYEIFGKYAPTLPEFSVPQDLVEAAARETDTALLVIGRSAGGEECDRHLENDYYLSEAEQVLVDQLSVAFPNIIVVLNCNGLIDLSWVEKHPSLKSLLFLGAPGEQGPAALARILVGEAVPSGKLAVTIARNYEDYPASQDFSWDKDHPENIRTYEDYSLKAHNDSRGFVRRPVTVYREDIYLGYRYADSFGVKPLFPFGFGLSYTEFGFEAQDISRREDGLLLTAQVENLGDRAGREVMQLYVSALNTESPRPYQELKGFVKTGRLAPRTAETAELHLPWRELSCYVEDAGAWVIEKGSYLLRLGNSSANTKEAGIIHVPESIILQKTGNRLSLVECNRDKLAFLSPDIPAARQVPEGLKSFNLSPCQVEVGDPAMKLPEDCSRLSIEELAALCVGYGPGLPFAFLMKTEEPLTIFDETGEPVTSNDHPAGYNGYVSPAIEKRGIHSVFYKDGPAGIGATAWPTEMLLACSFDTELCREFGDAVGGECEAAMVDVWLGPALNLHRHPLGGRNFEYLSEDPFLSGACARAIMGGVQENHPVLVCAKHFACNEQETYRRGSGKEEEGKRAFDAVDSILTERTARELYLKPFEMLVNAGLHCIMTSFNKINGAFAGGSKDLCTHILREEWGFDGAVVTDWGDMDIVVDGADAVAAGNDVIMPGGPPVIRQILKGFQEGKVTRRELETAVGHLINMLKHLGRYEA